MASLRTAFAIAATAVAIVAAAADTMTGVFNDRIRTLQVFAGCDPLSMPVAVLGDPEGITMEFDHLADDREYFRYSLEYCDARWQPSGLVDSEFLDGFNEGTVDDYAFSEATSTHYVHYSLKIPDEQIQLKLSGNYLLKVYPESEPDSIVLQCRFMVSEQAAPVHITASPITDIDYMAAHQQLEIAIDTEGAMVEDPFNDLLVVVGQNGRLDSEIALSHPLRMSGTTAIFAHNPALIFEAGNEYRRFETVTDHYPGMGVERIDFYDPYYHYTLAGDTERASQQYVYDQTQAGKFLVRRQGMSDSATGADYGVVHFSLDIPEMPGAMVFLDGDFTLRRFDENARMQFNHATGRYERAMLLKQGSYNYQYLTVPPGARRGYTATIEGDKYQSANTYTVRVYHRRRGERHHRLIGVGMTSLHTPQ